MVIFPDLPHRNLLAMRVGNTIPREVVLKYRTTRRKNLRFLNKRWISDRLTAFYRDGIEGKVALEPSASALNSNISTYCIGDFKNVIILITFNV